MKIYWTESAQDELQAVFEYYKNKVGLNVARKIKKTAYERTKLLKKQPHAGQIEDFLKELGLGHRYLVEGNYKILDRIVGENIFITDFFDTRQDPRKLIDKER